MEKFRHKVGRSFLILSLLLNLIFIGGGVVFFKTHTLDLPLLALILNKNCDQGLAKLVPLPDPQIANQLTAKFCQTRPAPKNP